MTTGTDLSELYTVLISMAVTQYRWQLMYICTGFGRIQYYTVTVP